MGESARRQADRTPFPSVGSLAPTNNHTHIIGTYLHLVFLDFREWTIQKGAWARRWGNIRRRIRQSLPLRSGDA